MEQIRSDVTKFKQVGFGGTVCPYGTKIGRFWFSGEFTISSSFCYHNKVLLICLNKSFGFNSDSMVVRSKIIFLP